jgi:competence protein ComFB
MLFDERDYRFELLKNEAEGLVLQELEYYLDSQGQEICCCEECVMDMAAMALNTVKPMYRYSLMGRLYAAQVMTEQVYADSIRQAVSNAVAKVSSNPSH